MGEKGRVIDIKENNIAVISFNRTEACAKCKACMSGFTEAEMILEASNSINAKKGNLVVIELRDKAFITSAAIMYAVPLLMMVSGFFIGSKIPAPFGLNSELVSFLLGMVLLAITYCTIHFFEKKIKASSLFLPYVASIVED